MALTCATFVVASPSITQQPEPVSVVAGADAVFQVGATGLGAVAYQWRHLGVPIAGATAAELTVPAVGDADAGFYDVVVSADGESVVSATSRLWISPAVDADCYRVDPSFAFAAEAPGAGVTTLRRTAAGDVLVGGWFTTITGVRRDGLARYSGGLVLDPSFAPVIAGEVDAIVELANGGLLNGGGFTHVNGVPPTGVARLHADGSLDESFRPGDGFNGNVFALVVLPDGSIVAGGAFTTFDGTPRGRIARIRGDGSLHPAFASGSGFSAQVRALALQPDGRLVVGGSFTTFGGVARSGIARVDAAGTLDPTLGAGTGFNGGVEAVVVQPDGSVLVGGSFTSFDGAAANRVVKLDAQGARDPGFTAWGAINGGVRALGLAGDGKVWVGGDFTTTERRFVARLNGDGSVDGGWNPVEAARTNTRVRALAVVASDSVVAGGEFTQMGVVANSASGLVRYSSAAALEAAPTGAFRQAASVRAAVAAPGGGWYIGGSFTTINGVERNRIARITATGAVDPGFDPGPGFDASVDRLARQGGGVLAAGTFSHYAGEAVNQVVRLRPDGTLDSEFAFDIRVTGRVYDLSVQGDGRILVGGSLSTYYGGTRNSVARVGSDGALDESFDLGPQPGGTVLTVAPLDSGEVVVGGSFTLLGGVSRARAALLAGTGAVGGFNDGTGFDASVQAAAVRPDGSFVLGGGFGSWATTARGRLAGFSASGTLDTAFNVGAGAAGGDVFGLLALADGRVLASGTFSTLEGARVPGLVRFGATGGADAAFRVFGLSIGQNRGVLAGGDGRLLVLSSTGANGGARPLGMTLLAPIVRRSYAGWAAAHFAEAELLDPAVVAPDADPDGAGVPNLFRYAFGLPARGAVDSPTAVEIVEEGGAGFLAIRFDRVSDADDLLYTVQASADLVSWSDIEVLGPGVPLEQVVRDSVALTDASRRFLRVAVELMEE